MAKLIYRVILIIAVALGIFFLGAIVNIANPVRYLLITGGIVVILSIGYLLGKKSHYNRGE